MVNHRSIELVYQELDDEGNVLQQWDYDDFYEMDGRTGRTDRGTTIEEAYRIYGGGTLRAVDVPLLRDS